MYKCIKSFFIDRVDDDGFSTETQFYIGKDSSWSVPEETDHRFIGGEVRLETEDGTWIEITKENFEQNFIEI